MRACRATTMASNDVLRGVPRTAAPGLSKRRRRTSATAAVVVLAAEVEVGPLGDGAGAGDAGGVGAEEVGLVEGSCVGDTGEDGEEEEDEGAGDEDEGGDG